MEEEEEENVYHRVSEIVSELTTNQQLWTKIQWLRNYILNMIKVAKETPRELRERYKVYIRTYTKILLIYMIELYARTKDVNILKKIAHILGALP